MRYLTIIIIFCVFNSCKINKSNRVNYDVSIIFGDCFNKDLVSLAVNEHLIFSNIELESNFSTGLTGVYLFKENGATSFVLNIKGVKKEIGIPITQSLLFEVKKETQSYKKSVNLIDGRNILIDGCNNHVQLQQSKMPLVFE